jgi:hypothetical protein
MHGPRHRRGAARRWLGPGASAAAENYVGVSWGVGGAPRLGGRRLEASGVASFSLRGRAVGRGPV